MDDDPSGGLQSQGALLGAALRGIRKARGLRTSQVADAIGLPLRTYQRLEEGSGPFELDRIKLFADFTDSDPFAIVASIWLQSPEFAVRAIDILERAVTAGRIPEKRIDESCARVLALKRRAQLFT